MITAPRCASALGALLAIALPGAAAARPADVNIVNKPEVLISPEQNTVKLDPSANTVKLESNAVRPDASTVTAIVNHSSLASGTNVCSSLSFALPSGKPFVLDTVTVDFTGVRASNAPKAGIRLARKTNDGTTLQSVDLSIPLDYESGFSTAAGTGQFGILVMPNGFGSAAPGDIYDVSTCVNRGSASGGSALVLLTGTPAG